METDELNVKLDLLLTELSSNINGNVRSAYGHSNLDAEEWHDKILATKAKIVDLFNANRRE